MKQLIFRTMNTVHGGLYRMSGGKLGGSMRGAPVLLLRTLGRKSGKEYTTPLLFGRDGDNLVVIASKGGDPRNPAWYHNVMAGEAEVQVAKEQHRVRAREAEGDERERLWADMVALYPDYADYQQKTSRRIPVVVLEPV